MGADGEVHESPEVRRAYWRHVAYTNVAKCQVPGRNRTDVLDVCVNGGFTLTTVVDAVHPVAALT